MSKNLTKGITPCLRGHKCNRFPKETCDKTWPTPTSGKTQVEIPLQHEISRKIKHDQQMGGGKIWRLDLFWAERIVSDGLGLISSGRIGAYLTHRIWCDVIVSELSVPSYRTILACRLVLYDTVQQFWWSETKSRRVQRKIICVRMVISLVIQDKSGSRQLRMQFPNGARHHCDIAKGQYFGENIFW